MGLVLNAHEPINSSALSRSSRHQEDFLRKKISLCLGNIYNDPWAAVYHNNNKNRQLLSLEKNGDETSPVSYSYKLLYALKWGLAPISRADHMKHHDLLSKGCSILHKSYLAIKNDFVKKSLCMGNTNKDTWAAVNHNNNKNRKLLEEKWLLKKHSKKYPPFCKATN